MKKEYLHKSKQVFYVKLNQFIFLFLICILSACESDFNSEYPLVQTGVVERFEINGAWASAIVKNEGNLAIIDHGFVWSFYQPDPDISGDNVKSLGLLADKSFTALLPAEQLEFDVPIHIRAFIKTKESISYGSETIFTFEYHGSTEIPTPEILEISPNPYIWNDTLIISGRNFSLIKDNNLVYLDGFNNSFLKSIKVNSSDSDEDITEAESNFLTVISCTKNRIMAIAREYATSDTMKLFTRVKGIESQPYNIVPSPPIIESITPSSGTHGTMVVIQGRNLGFPGIPVKAYFNNFEAYIGGYFPYKSTMLIYVPNQLPVGPASLGISFVNINSTTIENAFTVTSPEITDFSPKSGLSGSQLTVYYKNASWDFKVFISGIQATAVSGSYNSSLQTGTITVIVPNMIPGEKEVKLVSGSLYYIASVKFTVI